MTEHVRVLHAEDDDGFADLTEAFLRRLLDEPTVTRAADGHEALERLDDGDFDCVISDFDMPGMTGLELLKTVRETHSLLPFILYTGKGTEEVASEAISAGVSDYLQKGGTESFELLANRVEHAVDEYRTRFFEEVTHQSPLDLVERITDAVLALDEDWTITYLNEAASAEFMQPKDELLDENLWEAFPEATETPVYEHYRDAVADAEARTVEYYYEPWETWYREHLYPSDTGLTVIFHDITESKRRERELERTRERTEIALRHTDSVIFEIEGETGEVTRHGGYQRYFDLEPAATPTVEAHLEAAVHPEDRDRFWDFYRALLAGDRDEGTLVYRTNPHAGGEQCWIEDSVVASGEPGDDRHVVGVAHDVTDREQAQSELVRQEHLTRQALDAIDELFYVLDTDGTPRQWNRRVPEVTGYSDAELADMPVTAHFPPAEHDAIEAAIEQALEAGESVVEATLVTADGERIPYEFCGVRMTGPDDEVIGIAGVAKRRSEDP